MPKLKSNYTLLVVLLLVLVFGLLIKPIYAGLLEPGAVTEAQTEPLQPPATDIPSSTTNPPVDLTATRTATAEAVDECSVDLPAYLFFTAADGVLMRMNLDDPEKKTAFAVMNSAPEFSPFDLSPTQNLIVYSGSEDNQQGIILMDLEGELVQRITEETTAYSSPRFSPSGNALAYTNAQDDSYDVSVVDLDGQVIAPFDINACQPEIAWLDEEHLLFITCGEDSDLSVLDIATGLTSPILERPGEDRAPDASPDGQLIAFACQAASPTNFALCILERDTNTVRIRSEDQYPPSAPSWTLSGDRIVFSTGEEIVSISVDGNGTSVLYASEMNINHPVLWHPQQSPGACETTTDGTPSVAEGSPYSTMMADECTACHVTVFQTHMERLEFACQECHEDLDQLHAGVEEANP